MQIAGGHKTISSKGCFSFIVFYQLKAETDLRLFQTVLTDRSLLKILIGSTLTADNRSMSRNYHARHTAYSNWTGSKYVAEMNDSYIMNTKHLLHSDYRFFPGGFYQASTKHFCPNYKKLVVVVVAGLLLLFPKFNLISPNLFLLYYSSNMHISLKIVIVLWSNKLFLTTRDQDISVRQDIWH